MKRIRILWLFFCTALMTLGMAALTPSHAMAEQPKANDDYIYQYNSKYNGIEILDYKGTDSVITVPESIDGIPVTVIGVRAFDETYEYPDLNAADAIAEVRLPDSVTLIKEEAFAGCRLQKIVLPKNLKSFKRKAFSGCLRLQEINLPDGLTEIPACAFDCSGLKNIVIPPNVRYIGDDAFFTCMDLEEVVFAKNSKLKTIGKEAFCRCYRLKKLTFPDSLEMIEVLAFDSNYKLAKITFGKNSKLKELDGGCFAECKSLAKITLPKKLKKIKYRVFDGCKKLRQITFQGPAPSIERNTFHKISSKAVFKVPAKYKSKYVKALTKETGFKKKTMKIKSA